MADASRDLVIAAVSKTDKFDLSDVAQDLERTGDAAQDTGRKMDESLTDAAKSAGKLGDAVKDAGRASKEAGRELDAGLSKGEKAIDSLGDKADSTRADLSRFMDKIGADAKKAGREVDSGLKKAGEGLATFKDESRQTGRESAASFAGGFNDITDIVQEIGANAFAGLGAVGGALGIAGAAVFGTLISQAQEANEKVKAVRQSLRDLFTNTDTTAVDRVEAFFSFLNDNTDTEGLQRALRAAGVSINDFVRAGVEGGPILDEVQTKLRKLGGSGAGIGGFWDSNVRGAQGAFDALSIYREGLQGASLDASTQTQVTKDLTGATKEQADATSEAASTMAASAEAYDSAGTAAERAQSTFDTTAEAIRSVGDASSEIAKKAGEDGRITAREIRKILDAQTKAAREFTKNLLAVQKQGDEDFTAWVAKQPAEVAAAYASGTKKEKAGIYKSFKDNVGAQQALGTAKGLEEGKTTVRDAAGNVYTVARNALTGEPIVVPVKVGTPPSSGPGSVAAAEEAARRRLSKPIVVPINFVANPIWRAVP